LSALRERIAALSDREVSIVGVTKGFAPEMLIDVHAAGIRQIGENYAQELVSKAQVIQGLDGCEVHFIGQLQTNKVRMLVGHVDRFDSVDRPGLAMEIARRVPGARVLIQVDTSGTPGKGGCAPEAVANLCEQSLGLGLKVEGLMTVGPTVGGPEAARLGFGVVRTLVDSLGLAVCSMGMSHDLEVALSEGATEVRIGTALFGSRL
jgi:pyridoxal phosphate enzyme (YggS family)